MKKILIIRCVRENVSYKFFCLLYLHVQELPITVLELDNYMSIRISLSEIYGPLSLSVSQSDTHPKVIE